MTKVCSKCGATKPVDLYYKSMGRCKECHKAATVKWASLNPEKVVEAKRKFISVPENKAKSLVATLRWQSTNRERMRATQSECGLRRRYGLSLTQYNQLCARQDFRCAICGSDDTRLYVDHNHTTDKVRGLLCNTCNRGIGLLKDNPAVLSRAAQYVS